MLNELMRQKQKKDKAQMVERVFRMERMDGTSFCLRMRREGIVYI